MKKIKRTFFYKRTHSHRTPIAEKLLEMLVLIQLVPGTFSNSQQYNLKYRSPRFVLGILLWTIFPSIVMGYIIVLEIRPALQEDISVEAIFNLADYMFTMLSFWFLQASTVNLVYKCCIFLQRPLLLPYKQIIMLLCLSTNAAASVLYWIKLEGADCILAVITYTVYGMNFLTSMFLINMFTNTFINRCQKFNTMSTNELMIAESKLLIEEYSALEAGLGPAFVFHYGLSVPYITCYAYWLATGASLVNEPFVVVSYTLLIWNLAFLSQDCFSSLQSTSDTLGYV